MDKCGFVTVCKSEHTIVLAIAHRALSNPELSVFPVCSKTCYYLIAANYSEVLHFGFRIMNQRINHTVLFISFSQFGMAFSFNFVMVFLPFYIHSISPYEAKETLFWIGIIMGGASFAAAFMSPVWGVLASRYNAKTLFMRGLLSHAVIIFVMGFVSNLPLFFALRIVQGILGGVSTVALIIISSSSTQGRASRDIGFFQNMMTCGQLIGPPAGALAAASFGYKGAFISASVLVLITILFCWFNVADVEQKPRQKEGPDKPNVDKRNTFAAWSLVFTFTVQLMFLPSILPNVFEGFNIGHAIALKWAGLVVMLYTVTAVIGTFLLCRLTPRISSQRLIVAVGLAGIVLQALLAVSPGIISFIVIRMCQTALIAAILPLVFSLFSSDLNGKVIGFLNSGRFAGNAMGPMIGASVLALSNLSWLCLFMSGLSLAAMLGFVFFFRPMGNGRIF